MIFESPYWRNRLAPRCRLITSWGCKWSQGFGCSPIKVVRELGLERRETVWSLSSIIAENWKVEILVREDRILHKPLVYRLFYPKHGRVATFVKDNYWQHISKKLALKKIFKKLWTIITLIGYKCRTCKS